MNKDCTRCGVEKPATREYFRGRKQGVLKLDSHCIECRRLQYKEWATKNPDKVKKRNRDHYRNNPEYHKARQARRYQEKDKPKRRERHAKWQADYKTKNGKSWGQVSWERRRHKPEVMIRNRIRAALNAALRARTPRRPGLEATLGYTVEDLRRHLERQFGRGMSWDNMGKWHIDHIVPQASFKYQCTDDPEFKACWALTNLRPLWGIKNLEKKDKREFLL